MKKLKTTRPMPAVPISTSFGPGKPGQWPLVSAYAGASGVPSGMGPVSRKNAVQVARPSYRPMPVYGLAPLRYDSSTDGPPNTVSSPAAATPAAAVAIAAAKTTGAMTRHAGQPQALM